MIRCMWHRWSVRDGKFVTLSDEYYGCDKSASNYIRYSGFLLPVCGDHGYGMANVIGRTGGLDAQYAAQEVLSE